MITLLLLAAFASPEATLGLEPVREITVEGLIAVAPGVALEGIETEVGQPLVPEVAVTPESELDMEGHRVHLTFTVEAPGAPPSTAPGQLLPSPINPL